MGEAGEFQRRAPAGMKRLRFLLEPENRAQLSGSLGLNGEGSVSDAVQPAGAGVVVGQPTGYALALEPSRGEHRTGWCGVQPLV